jgi:hypothetical protein
VNNNIQLDLQEGRDVPKSYASKKEEIEEFSFFLPDNYLRLFLYSALNGFLNSKG